MPLTVKLSVGNLSSTTELQIRASRAGIGLPSNSTLRCWSDACTSHMDVFFGYDFPRLYPGEIVRAMPDMYAANKEARPLEVRYRIAGKDHETVVISSNSSAVEGMYSWNLSASGLHSAFTLNRFSTPQDTYVTNIEAFFPRSVSDAEPAFYFQWPSSTGVNQTFNSSQPGVLYMTFPANVAVQTASSSSTSSPEWLMYSKAMLRITKLNFSDDAYKLRAVTDLQLVNSSKAAEQYVSKGYVMVAENLLGLGALGEIYLVYKRGAGPPILDFSMSYRSGYSQVREGNGRESVGVCVRERVLLLMCMCVRTG
eukprot:767046-Hanusia_phi.AAC.1